MVKKTVELPVRIKVPAAIEQQVATIAIREYAVLSYLYYDRDVSLVPDYEFDMLCVFLKENFDWIKKYDLNGYLKKSALDAGTGYNVKIKGLTKETALWRLKEAEERGVPW